MIGDGYGFLGLLISRLFPTTKVVSVNLGPILFFDVLMTSMEETSVAVCHGCGGRYRSERKFNFVAAEVVDQLEIGDIDIFINIASMQEMDIEVIHKYFHWMRAQRNPAYFYSCNRVSKELPDGTIVKFDDYAWENKDEFILNELCEWYQKAPSNRFPFYQKFDGPHHHRLAKLA